MAVFGGVPMPRKMLGSYQHWILAIRMRAIDVGFHKTRHLFGVLAERANVDDRIVGIVVDVRNRREHPVHAHGTRVASGVGSFFGDSSQILRGAECHAVRPRCCRVHTHGSAAFEIGCDEQRRSG